MLLRVFSIFVIFEKKKLLVILVRTVDCKQHLRRKRSVIYYYYYFSKNEFYYSRGLFLVMLKLWNALLRQPTMPPSMSKRFVSFVMQFVMKIYILFLYNCYYHFRRRNSNDKSITKLANVAVCSIIISLSITIFKNVNHEK